MSANNGVILGRSDGGQPRRLLSFSSVQEAQDTLVSGELLEAVAHAFNPAPGFAPQRVLAMVVNGNARAERAVKCGGTAALAVKSAGWGAAANRLSLRVSGGRAAGSLRLDFASGELAQTADNIPAGAIRVKGGPAGAVISAANDGLKITFAGAGGKDKAGVFIPFSRCPALDDLARELNAAGFEAAAEGCEGSLPSGSLDAAPGAEVPEGGLLLTRGLAALAEALEASGWVSAVEKTEGANNAMPDFDAAPVFFTGAVGGTFAEADWRAALLALEAEDVQIVSTPSADAAVHTLISNHCSAMSGVQNRKERTALLGGAAGETVDAAVERAAALNSKLVSYCYPGITALSPLSGRPQDLSAAFFACKLLGLECAVAVNEPLTWKTVSVLGFSRNLRISEMDALISGGVLCGGFTDDRRLAVIRAMTTHRGRQLQLCERSMVRQDLFMNRDFRNRVSRGVGRPGLDKGGSALQTLTDAARAWAGEGLIVPNGDGENIWDARVVRRADAVFVAFHRNLAAPQNFFFITAFNHVYSSAAEFAV